MPPVLSSSRIVRSTIPGNVATAEPMGGGLRGERNAAERNLLRPYYPSAAFAQRRFGPAPLWYGFQPLSNRDGTVTDLVEPRGIEPLTFALRTRRSPS